MQMHIIRYNRWLGQKLEDPDLTAELQAIQGDTDAIRERFAIDLSFGTAGMRGVIGAGTNRMNIYTVRRATQGLAAWLNKAGENPSVAISFDSRIKSDLFAQQAAAVLAANSVRVWLYPQLEPVPVLSFAVRRLGASAGVMITASHNPAQYNGYKVYGPDGCQLSTAASGSVLGEIERLDVFDDVQIMPFDKALQDGLITFIGDDVLTAFTTAVTAQSIRPGLLAIADLQVVYSPLNGAGNVPVRRVLAACGLKSLTVVPEQEYPDGNFPTCPYPNPEIRDTLNLGIELAKQKDADLVLATDPDADRVGIAVRDTAGEYRLLTGNEVGVLLLNFICVGRKEAGTMPARPVAVKSIVSTPMADEVARHHGVELIDVLTGFKYIGEQILKLEQKGEEDRFIFGFEESYGYLAGTHVRDKDAVVASMLICEMAAWYKAMHLDLYAAMQALYDTYGYYLNEVENFDFEGLAGMEKMDEIMAQQRKTPPEALAGLKVLKIADYQAHTLTDTDTGETAPLELPASNVLRYTLEGGSGVTVRPSGTEPKVKVYYAIRAANRREAEATHKALAAAMQPMLT
uniref:Putative phosphoglucomutase n=1 Tax=termite gut metagenome TaxID=433724 RepID=S0DFT1_9ZZZZ